MNSKILFLWLISGLTLSTTSESYKGINKRSCHPNDLKGLNDFKQGIVIDTSGRLKRWHGHDSCKWEGIYCDNITGRVIQLYLSGVIDSGHLYIPLEVNMAGLISPSITLLTYLEVIDLSGEHYLQGTIPPSIGFDLPRLRQLFLNGNRLTGQIPSSIGRLSNLSNLGLSGNMIEGSLLKEMSMLSNLQFASLSGNRLTGRIPEEFLKLTYISELELSGNDLAGEIPQGPPLINLREGSYWGNKGLCGKPPDPCRS